MPKKSTPVAKSDENPKPPDNQGLPSSSSAEKHDETEGIADLSPIVEVRPKSALRPNGEEQKSHEVCSSHLGSLTLVSWLKVIYDWIIYCGWLEA